MPLRSIIVYSHTFYCPDESFLISNEIVTVYFKICACVQKTKKLKVIRKDVKPKAIDKTLICFWSKHIGVI